MSAWHLRPRAPSLLLLTFFHLASHHAWRHLDRCLSSGCVSIWLPWEATDLLHILGVSSEDTQLARGHCVGVSSTSGVAAVGLILHYVADAEASRANAVDGQWQTEASLVIRLLAGDAAGYCRWKVLVSLSVCRAVLTNYYGPRPAQQAFIVSRFRRPEG